MTQHHEKRFPEEQWERLEGRGRALRGRRRKQWRQGERRKREK